MKLIAVGSKNPVKRNAVEAVVNSVWKEVKVVAEDVDSGVSDQPMSESEAIKGATNRAERAKDVTNADMGFGLEEYVNDTQYRMFLGGWVVAVDNNGRRGLSSKGSIQLPDKIADKVRKGKELGTVTDDHFDRHNVKHQEGTFGVLTDRRITRTKSFEYAIVLALAKFITPELYTD